MTMKLYSLEVGDTVVVKRRVAYVVIGKLQCADGMRFDMLWDDNRVSTTFYEHDVSIQGDFVVIARNGSTK